mmetsp:Transcript_15851/g.34932  ORF Transcript_15851/g.34932 Transcript_15851/m.34932 type:complete len:268 (-) Transcript_15851:878-1681(-)
MEFLTTNLKTCTSCVCPMRWTRCIAWSSTAGFHQRSIRYTLVAAVKFSPVPPALRDTSNTRPLPSGSWTHRTTSRRPATPIDPSNRFTGASIPSIILCNRSRNPIHCEKTTARLPAARSSFSNEARESILVENRIPEASAPKEALDRPGTAEMVFFVTPGALHSGQCSPMRRRASSQQARHITWPHWVIIASSGTSKQIGQLLNSPAFNSANLARTKSSVCPFVRRALRRNRSSAASKSLSWWPWAKVSRGWHNACRRRRISCRMCV